MYFPLGLYTADLTGRRGALFSQIPFPASWLDPRN